MIVTRADFSTSTQLADAIKSLRTKAGAIGLIFLALTVVGAFIDAPPFFRSYLYSFLFLVGLSAGCLAWLMIQYLSGGAWGVMSRRVCEAAAGVMPVWVVFFIPLILGINSLYGTSWANPAIVAHDPVLQNK